MVAEPVLCSTSTKSRRGAQEQPAEQKNNKKNNSKSIVIDDSNQPTFEDLNVIGEMGPTPLRTRVHPMGGHQSDSSSDGHMPSLMLRLTYSNLQAVGALVRPTYRPLTTQQHLANELRQVNLGPG